MISLLARLIDVLAPRECAVCGCRLGVAEDVICGPCNFHLPRTNYSARPYDNEMARLFWHLVPIERAAALFFYEAASPAGNVIHKLKYHNRPDIAVDLGRMAAAEWARDGFFDGIDAICPVPLAKNRQRERGYNQSECIAKGISEIAKVPVMTKVVSRDVFVKSQTTMNRWQRQENVDGVFHLQNAKLIAGKHILLVDDVVTSGATVTALATEMMAADNIRFSVASLGFAH